MTYQGNVDETRQDFGGVVSVSGNATGILELAKAAIHEFAQPVRGANQGQARFEEFVHRDGRNADRAL